MKHQIAAVRAELDPEQQSNILDSLELSVDDMNGQIMTGSPVVDTVVNQKAALCRQSKISFVIMADGHLLDQFHPLKIASMLGNALDNAIETTSKIQADHRRIEFDLRRQRKPICIMIRNSFDGTIKVSRAGELLTRKADRTAHGIGVASIRFTVEELGGHLSWSTDGDTFILRILLPDKS